MVGVFSNRNNYAILRFRAVPFVFMFVVLGSLAALCGLFPA